MIFKEFCRVLQLEAQAITHRLNQIQNEPLAQKTIETCVELLLAQTSQGGKVLVIGLGKSGKIGAKIAATLASTGTPAVYIHPTEALHGDLGVVTEKDVVIAISYTGNTEELLSLLPYFSRRGVKIIALTGKLESKLAKLSDYVLSCEVSEEACAHNLAPTSSTTLTLAIGDALAIAVMKARGFTPEDFAKNHPGGALGRRLQLLVKDLMHALPQAPVLPESATMDEVISLSTEKKLGAILVCEGSKLKGIITDGDIRRALKRREQFFQLTAQEVMTRFPVFISPEQLAYDALRLMEERESQITVLPVIDGEGNALGLVRIHDLVQTF